MNMSTDTSIIEATRPPLKVLYLEDDSRDCELIAERLKADGLPCEFTRATTRREFEDAARHFNFDLILSDYTIPSYHGAAALEFAAERQPGVPFIFVSGTIGEERAVDSLKAGATDYIIKGHLERLAPSIRRALRETTNRRRRKLAEEALRASEEHFRTVFDAAPIGIYNADADGRILRANRTIQEMLGYTELELQSLTARSLTHSADVEQSAEMFKDLTTGKIDCVRVEKRFVRKDGGFIWAQVTASAVRDYLGRFQYNVSLIEDITEKKKMEIQFLRAQRMESIGTLASGIAHDLNNILAPISIAAQLLRMKELDEDSGQMLDRIETSAKRGAEVVRQVLTFARGIEGRRALLQPRHLLREVLKIIEETFPKSIEVESWMPDGLWPVTGDATQLHQVLLNLCVNARDAMPDGGTLQLSAKNLLMEDDRTFVPGLKAGPYVLLEVTDTGTGIPAEIREKIFEPFFTTKELGKGTGLGLSTVLGIVKSHSGWISVYSEPGNGSTFKVFLPAVPDDAAPNEIRTQTNLPQGRGELLLVVDDEAAIRDLMRKILVRQGYNVLVAADGVEALALFSEHSGKINLVLTDMMMPRMEGLALIHAIKKIDPACKIIATSGLANVADQKGRNEELKSLGVRDFLQKPCEPEKMLTTIRSLLD